MAVQRWPGPGEDILHWIRSQQNVNGGHSTEGDAIHEGEGKEGGGNFHLP